MAWKDKVLNFCTNFRIYIWCGSNSLLCHFEFWSYDKDFVLIWLLFYQKGLFEGSEILHRLLSPNFLFIFFWGGEHMLHFARQKWRFSNDVLQFWNFLGEMFEGVFVNTRTEQFPLVLKGVWATSIGTSVNLYNISA